MPEITSAANAIASGVHSGMARSHVRFAGAGGSGRYTPSGSSGREGSEGGGGLDMGVEA
jgi:hypothetical protein